VELKRIELEDRLERANVDPAAVMLARKALDDQDVATAERITLELERGQPLPAPTAVDVLFEQVFPAVPDRLATTNEDGRALAEALRVDGTLFNLPASARSSDAAGRAANALDQIPLIVSTRPEGPRAVGGVLDLLGLSVASIGSGPTHARWRSYAVQARVSDKALVPRFGSQTGGRYRVWSFPARTRRRAASAPGWKSIPPIRRRLRYTTVCCRRCCAGDSQTGR
jgi:hypothetical protein